MWELEVHHLVIVFRLDEFSCALGRSIVDDDEFERLIRLLQDGIDTLLKQLLAIVCRHYDRYERIHSGISSF